MTSDNPLFDDREVDFQLYDVHDVGALTALPAFADHSRETFDLVLGETRKLARTAFWPLYRELDRSPTFEAGAIRLHPKMKDLYGRLVGLGLIPATRGPEVGGQNLPLAIDCVAQMYVCAANLGPASFFILCRGPGHLIEAFGSDELKRRFMDPLYRGEWTGTMALTEPHAGSSLADVTTPRDAARRHLPRPRREDLHLRRRSRSHREHRAHDARAHRGRAGGHQGRLALRGAQAQRDDGDARRQRRRASPA